MANCCFVRLVITCKKPKELKTLHRQLLEAAENASEECKGMYIGSTEKYLFDASCVLTDKRLVITGWTKWSLPKKDFAAIYWHMLDTAPSISSVVCTYEEFQTDFIGKYEVSLFQGYQTQIIEAYLSEAQIDDLRSKYTEYFQGAEDEFERYQEDCRSLLESFPCRTVYKLGQLTGLQPA